MTDLARWPVLVLTAGLATRLRPLSDVRAKAAMPVAGKPIIGRILEWLRAAGVRHVVLNLHHRPETITRLVGDGSGWDVDVRYSWEGRVLGSAGGPRRALQLLDADRFLIVNGDTLTDCDVHRLVHRHLDACARVTMAVIPGDVGRYGGVLVRGDGVIAGFGTGTGETRALHFIGVQAVEADVFAGLPEDETIETVRTLYPALIPQDPRAIVAYESNAEFLDVGTAADYHRTVATVVSRERVGFDRGENRRIDPSSRLENTVLWDRVVVGRDAELINCVVADDVLVPGGTHFERCALVASADGLVTRAF